MSSDAEHLSYFLKQILCRSLTFTLNESTSTAGFTIFSYFCELCLSSSRLERTPVAVIIISEWIKMLYVRLPQETYLDLTVANI